VYGPNGSGKTRFAGSAPKVLLADVAEEGDRSIKKMKGARVAPINNWNNIGTLYWYLKSGKHPFESVAIDTITAMHEMAMDFVLGEAEERDLTRVRAMPQQKDWNRSGQLVKGMAIAFRNLPMHVIFTAQERVIRDKDTEEVIDITVDLPAGARGTVMGCVGILGRMVPKEIRIKSEGKVRKEWVDNLITAKHEVMKTKDRTNGLPSVLKRPVMGDIIECWLDQ
jgi:hypothetical protein